MRGPIVYCFEGVDNGEQLQALVLLRGAKIETVREEEGILKGCVSLKAVGFREGDSDALYSENPPERKRTELKAVPYYLWGNRGLNQMRVWIRETGGAG